MEGDGDLLPVKQEEGNTDVDLETAIIVPYEDTMTSLNAAESDRTDRMSDDDDEDPSSGSEGYDDGDLLASAMDDDVTAQLAAAGWQIKNILHRHGDFPFFASPNPLVFFLITKITINFILFQETFYIFSTFFSLFFKLKSVLKIFEVKLFLMKKSVRSLEMNKFYGGPISDSMFPRHRDCYKSSKSRFQLAITSKCENGHNQSSIGEIGNY